MKIRFLIIMLVFGAFFFAAHVQAAAPVLNFSDLVSGPATGNTDGLGSGVIVTIWGNNLGLSQGASKIYIGNIEATQVYYWKNADGQLPGGPAKLYSSHKMQEISFAVPAEAVVGANTIKVVIDSVDSNTLPFMVRTGDIYFIKPTGSDTTGDGSWSNSWQTLNATFIGNTGKTPPGTTVYSVGVGSTNGLKVGDDGSVAGAENNSIALIAYPNTVVDISGHGGDGCVITNWYESVTNNDYVDFSKLKVTAYGNGTEWSNGIEAFAYGRIVGVEITGPNVYGGYGGAITGSNGVPQGGKYLGIYIHDYGYDNDWNYNPNTETWTSPPYDGIAGINCTNCTSVDRFQHLYYVSCRGNTGTCLGYEIGWNNLVDNPILHSLHIYDMSGDGTGWHGTLSVHDNYVDSQVGGAIDISVGGNSTADIEIYNNVIVNTDGPAFRIYATGSGKAVVYNNTVYGQTWAGFGGSVDEFRNNIMFDLDGTLYMNTMAPIHSGNLTYSTGGASVPSWSDINQDPLFANPGSGDTRLLTGSPAIDQGDTTIYNFGLHGVARPQGTAFDIGAYEYYEGASCDIYYLDLCLTENECTITTGNWCDNDCQLETCDIIRANVDQQNGINTTDAMLTLRNSLGLDMLQTNWNQTATTGNVNCDGNSNAIDAVLLLRYSLGLDMSETDWCE